MFMDRYLWNLHLGTQRLLSKARGAGAPVDGVVISAGIPELDEAVARARENGRSWQQIGDILGMTRQGVNKRFSAA